LPSSLQQPAASPYPNIQSPATVPSNSKLESYYTASPTTEPYGRSQSTYAGYPSQQSPYVQHTAPQRTQFTSQPSEQAFSSGQPYPPQQFYDANAPHSQTRSSSVSYQPSEAHTPQFQRNPADQYAAQPSQPPPMTPSQPPGNVTSDPAAAFYFPERQTSVSQSTAPTQTASSPLQQRQPSASDIAQQGHVQRGTIAGPPQPQAQQGMPPMQMPTLPSQPQSQPNQAAPAQQPIASGPVQRQFPPQGRQWQQNPPYPSDFASQSFPAVPQHQPKVEEALIEL
jgi:hypothetical protein